MLLFVPAALRCDSSDAHAGQPFLRGEGRTNDANRFSGAPAPKIAAILKSAGCEDRSEWNTVDVALEGDRGTHIVNGRIVNRARWISSSSIPRGPIE